MSVGPALHFRLSLKTSSPRPGKTTAHCVSPGPWAFLTDSICSILRASQASSPPCTSELNKIPATRHRRFWKARRFPSVPFPAGRWACSPGTMKPKRFFKNSTFLAHSIFMTQTPQQLMRWFEALLPAPTGWPCLDALHNGIAWLVRPEINRYKFCSSHAQVFPVVCR